MRRTRRGSLRSTAGISTPLCVPSAPASRGRPFSMWWPTSEPSSGSWCLAGEIPTGLDTQIDTPRVYRGEKLPRALPWDTVREFLQTIDRTSPLGRRDYAIFLLMATYGLARVRGRDAHDR